MAGYRAIFTFYLIIIIIIVLHIITIVIAGNVARMGQTEVHAVFWGVELKESIHLEDLALDGMTCEKLILRMGRLGLASSVTVLDQAARCCEDGFEFRRSTKCAKVVAVRGTFSILSRAVRYG